MSGQTILILLVAGAVIAAFAILNALPRRQLARLKVRPTIGVAAPPAPMNRVLVRNFPC